MAAQQRELLEQLMKAPEARLDDPGVCKAYCVEFCIYDLFDKTRQVSGKCPFDHIKRLQQEYQAGKPIFSFEQVFRSQLDRCIHDCTNRIAAAKCKLEPSQADSELYEKAQQVTKSNQMLQLLRAEIRALVEVDPERALEHTKALEQHNQNHLQLLKDFDDLYFGKAPSGHQKLIICEVCGSTLSSQETDQHLAAHFLGKLHAGFVQVRKARARHDALPCQDKTRARRGQ